jgi:hypothetical protein
MGGGGGGLVEINVDSVSHIYIQDSVSTSPAQHGGGGGGAQRDVKILAIET